MRRFAVVLSLLSVVAGCSSPTSDDGSVVNDSAYTSERPDAGAGDVTPFTPADAPERYGARVRISFDGAPAEEVVSGASVDSWHPDAPKPYVLGLARNVYAYFGPPGAALQVGTYACADGDAEVFLASWNDDGTAKPIKGATACTFVIDAIEDGKPSSGYVRAYGRVQASKVEGGLPWDIRATFLADIPKPVRLNP